VGEYQPAPNFAIKIASDGEHLFAQATGQPKFEVFAEKQDEFFFKVVDAQLTFTKNDSGSVSGMILHQNGQDMKEGIDYAEMYGVLSKMSHPSPWAILGGTDAQLSWDSFALYLLIRANGYTEECIRHLLEPHETTANQPL
jgi:Domain of unknown function (DUF3471)